MTKMKIQTNGTPNDIHSAKDKSIPYILLIAPASSVFGGVPINLTTHQVKQNKQFLSIRALPNAKRCGDVSIVD